MDQLALSCYIELLSWRRLERKNRKSERMSERESQEESKKCRRKCKRKPWKNKFESTRVKIVPSLMIFSAVLITVFLSVYISLLPSLSSLCVYLFSCLQRETSFRFCWFPFQDFSDFSLIHSFSTLIILSWMSCISLWREKLEKRQKCLQESKELIAS